MKLEENEPIELDAKVLATAHAPGDMTRYDIRVITTPHERIVALLNARGAPFGVRGFGRVMVLPRNELCPTAGYIAEKMGLNEYDAGVIEKYLQQTFGERRSCSKCGHRCGDPCEKCGGDPMEPGDTLCATCDG